MAWVYLTSFFATCTLIVVVLAGWKASAALPAAPVWVLGGLIGAPLVLRMYRVRPNQVAGDLGDGPDQVA